MAWLQVCNHDIVVSACYVPVHNDIKYNYCNDHDCFMITEIILLLMTKKNNLPASDDHLYTTLINVRHTTCLGL